MNKASYDGLPDDLKAIIDANSGVETSGLAGLAMDIGDDAGEGVVMKRGNTIHTLDDATVAELKTIGERLTAEWINEVTEKGLDGAAMVESAQSLVSKYSDN